MLRLVRPRAANKTFLDSDDAKEKDEPQKYLPDYDKLIKGKDADWVYFPDGGMSKYKTVTVKEFDQRAAAESRDAAREGKDYMEQWLDKQGFKVVKSGGDADRRRATCSTRGSRTEPPATGGAGPRTPAWAWS